MNYSILLTAIFGIVVFGNIAESESQSVDSEENDAEDVSISHRLLSDTETPQDYLNKIMRDISSTMNKFDKRLTKTEDTLDKLAGVVTAVHAKMINFRQIDDIFVNSASSTASVPSCTEFSDSPSDCLASSLGCSYCHSKTNYNGSRCDLANNLIRNECTADQQCPNGAVFIKPVEPFKLNRVTPTYTTPKISLCLNQTAQFNVTFPLDEISSPLDLYVLMDFSGSMSDDKANLVRLSSDLIGLGKRLSRDFKIGFGTHVDKHQSGKSDYSFWNHLSLTKDYSGFVEAVKASTIRDGGDTPESQLEGLFQASACLDQIKWRSNSRRILLLLTDAQYHKAGDTSHPAFNGRCSLDATGKYTLDNSQDYPSEKQVIDIMKANQIVPIFAVTPDVTKYYTGLSQLIQPSGLASLTSDSSNILQVLDKHYEKITSEIQLTTEGREGERGLELKFTSKCNNGEINQKSNKCKNLGDQLAVSFGVQMTFNSCPTDKEQKVRIRAAGMPLYFDAILEIIC